MLSIAVFSYILWFLFVLRLHS